MGNGKLTIELPRLHTAQLQVIERAKRFTTLACGRRFGKTVLAQQVTVQEALKGAPTCWCSPSYKSLADCWRELRSTLTPVTADKSEAEHRLQLIGGGVIEMWSLDDVDAGRGRRYANLVVDEAAQVAKLEECWTRALRPALADMKGSALFCSTPKGVANYFHTLYQRGLDEERDDWASFRFPTGSNPYIAESEIAAMREDLPEMAYLQEVEAEFVSWTGSVFRGIAAAVNRPLPLVGKRIVAIDWAGAGGGVNADYTVLVAVDFGGTVLEIDRWRRLEYGLQLARVKTFCERHKPELILAEQNSLGGPLISQASRDGLRVQPFVTTSTSKALAVEALALAFERGAISIPDDPALMAELASFEATPLPSGAVRYAGAGNHDDMTMALMIAWSGIAEQQKMVLGLNEALKRIQAGVDRYGSIDAYFAAKDRDQQPLSQSEKCPMCEGILIQRLVRSELRCANCGWQWQNDGTGVQRPATFRDLPRTN